MADIREPPPDLFDTEDQGSEDDQDVAPVQQTDEKKAAETVEISLDNDEQNGAEDDPDDTSSLDAVNHDDEPTSDLPAEDKNDDTEETLDTNTKNVSEEKDSESPANDEDRQKKVTFKTEEELVEEYEETDDFDVDIKVSNPEKVGDGMSAFMQYKVTTTTSLGSFKKPETTVARRFSDFLGLYGRLNAKFLLEGKIVPPAPEKSVLGMTKVKMGKDEATSAEFVERRRASLERYLNRTASHPTLREDSDFRQFLEAESLPKATSTAALSGGGIKRLVKNVGDTMFNLTAKIEESDEWFSDKQQKIEVLEQQLKKLHQALESLVGNRKELSLSTAVFSNSLAVLSSAEEHTGLSRALSSLAEVEEKVDKVIQSQMETDFYVLCELLKDYLGLVHAVKLCFHQRLRSYTNLQTAKQNLTKKREALVKAELASKSDRIKQLKDEAEECERKVEKGQEEFKEISKTIKQEFSRFEHHRVKDFREAVVKYLEALMDNQQQILKFWEGFLPEAKEIA